MNFNCWYDRLGSKGYFNVQDFPMNMVQRRIEFEHDRQFEMEILDERRKMDYNRKENQLTETYQACVSITNEEVAGLRRKLDLISKIKRYQIFF